MLTLAWPAMLLLWPAPLLAGRWLPPAPSPSAALRWPSFDRVFGARAEDSRGGNGRRRLALALWTLLLLAAARPEWIHEPTGTPVSGRSLLMAVDVSASMRSAHLGQEIAMAIVRRTAREFLLGRAGDRVGLVLFGTQPYVQAPLTFDLEAVSQMVNEAVIGVAGEGTALGDALALSVGRLRALADEERVLVLLTDGASTSGLMNVGEAVTLARAHRIRVHTIGVEATDTDTGAGPDTEVLRSIATETGGRYFHATDPQGLEQVYRELDRLEPVARSASTLRVARALYPIPLALALTLGTVALAVHLAKERFVRA